MRYTTTLPVQFRDFDVLGHVNSTVYIQYMETARVRFLDHLAPRTDWYRVPIILASTRCEYRRPVTVATQVQVALWVSRIGNSSWDLDYEVRTPEGEVCVIGRTTQVAYDHEAQATVPVDADLRQRLEEHEGPPLLFRG